MTYRNQQMPARLFGFLAALLTPLFLAAAPGNAAQIQSLDLTRLPRFVSGIRAYPTPFLAIGKTPHSIASPQGGMGIQNDLGFLAGFSGFVDESTGQFGFPGYRNHSIANFAFDEDKLVIQMHVPYAEGRKLRANTQGDLLKDDTFELLIEPRSASGAGRGKVYRVIGNAVGVWRGDLDENVIGQVHRPWDSGISYASMLWDPTGGWMASIAIPFANLGGKPADGDVWGVQCAVRYPDPKITAILSPTDDFTDVKRFARIRFDFDRRVNYRAHWMTEDGRWFGLDHLLANGGTTPGNIELQVALYKGAKEIARDGFKKTASPGSTYGSDSSGAPRLGLASQSASLTERDTVAHVMVHDRTPGANDALIYDQWVPYWQRKPGERDWLKQYFGREFTLNIGPYPSLGILEFAIDTQTLQEANPTAAQCQLILLADGKEAQRLDVELPKTGTIARSINVGAFVDGVTYRLQATIKDGKGKTISERTESFTRHVMPFEKAARAGLSDIVISPFTPPVITGTSVSCWGRTYGHGSRGLLEKLIAANDDLLAAPAVFKAVLGDGATVTLTGEEPRLSPQGKGKVEYQQSFRGGGIAMQVKGVFDYDGFYRFTTTFAPMDGSVRIKELRLEIPLKPEHATLIDAPVAWMHKGGEKALGFLDTKPGRVWDSHTLPLDRGGGQSNMPPYIWVGDDDRGLCYSAESDQGTHNDPKLPAAALERSAQAVVMTIWMVNQPLQLDKPRTFEFALQASPFKPQPANGRLWRDGARAGGTYKNGVYFTNFWNPASYPTYGRWLTLEYLKKYVQTNGCDRTAVPASALSECSGTPEYLQFYYEWGSPMDQFKRFVAPVPADLLVRFKETGLEANPFVMVEAFSNTVASNRDYRVWWLSEGAKYAGLSYVYQDNAPWVYTDRPAPQYGYQREDGGIEPTSMIWKSRDLMKRFAHGVTEAGQPSQPAVWPNLMSPALPGRAFCGKALTGEYTDSDRLRLDMLRVHLSKQWGIVVDWLCQPPSSAGAQVGTTRKYWRAVCSQIFLLDVTNISRADTAEITRRWFNALDVFWLDDPTVKWHPYYRNPTVASVEHPATTLVSTYTAKGRLLAVVSNQDEKQDVIESVRFQNLDSYGAGGLRFFYDAETGEEIEVQNGIARLYVAHRDYRLVIGFVETWKFAARNRLPHPEQIPPQSTLDATVTVGEICRNLLASRELPPMPGAHRMTEAWAREIMRQLPPDSPDIVYLDAKATSGVDLGDAKVQCSVFYDRRHDIMLVGYYNGTDQDRTIDTSVRAKLAAKVGKASYNYIYDTIGGESQWSEIDVPARRGRWEVLDPDGGRRGVYAPGTLMSNMLEAIKRRKAQFERP